MASLVFLRLPLVLTVTCLTLVQNNVEASGAVEDEVLAPGGAEAGAVSIEPLQLLIE